MELEICPIHGTEMENGMCEECEADEFDAMWEDCCPSCGAMLSPDEQVREKCFACGWTDFQGGELLSLEDMWGDED